MIPDSHPSTGQRFVAIQISVLWRRSAPSRDCSVFLNLYLATSAEGVGNGLVRNPVVPELHADALAAGVLRAGFEGSLAENPIRTRFGLLGGSGYEKRIDAFSTDLIEKLPVRDGHLYLFGLEQEASAVTYQHDWKLTTAPTLREIEFHSSVAPSDLDTAQGADFMEVRWKSESEAMTEIHLPLFVTTQAGIVVVAGPQPLPVDILPVVWDYSHKVQSFPEIGAMVGAGGVSELSWSSNSSWKTTAGFFGGYWGGTTGVLLGSYQLNLGTWGIEASSAYRTLGLRIWTGDFSVSF